MYCLHCRHVKDPPLPLSKKSSQVSGGACVKKPSLCGLVLFTMCVHTRLPHTWMKSDVVQLAESSIAIGSAGRGVFPFPLSV